MIICEIFVYKTGECYFHTLITGFVSFQLAKVKCLYRAGYDKRWSISSCGTIKFLFLARVLWGGHNFCIMIHVEPYHLWIFLQVCDYIFKCLLVYLYTICCQVVTAVAEIWNLQHCSSNEYIALPFTECSCPEKNGQNAICEQRRSGPVCANAQTGLDLRWSPFTLLIISADRGHLFKYIVWIRRQV